MRSEGDKNLVEVRKHLGKAGDQFLDPRIRFVGSSRVDRRFFGPEEASPCTCDSCAAEERCPRKRNGMAKTFRFHK
ncbi:MAG: hypothetical protein VR65_08600 [Desulfobulbaceae bacterium BRH_c16a]|nr:MAG: hypothetical protein VR65_08600 [Desulfobulbaceae bacterium BRH_c16a]